MRISLFALLFFSISLISVFAVPVLLDITPGEEGITPAYVMACHNGSLHDGQAGPCPPPAPTPGAGGLIPCAGPDCNFSHLITFVNTIVDWLLRIAIPITAVLFSYAGFLYLTSGGAPAKKTAANKVFRSVFWGFVMALGAWVFVNFLTNFFLGKDINEVVPVSQGGIIETYDLA